MNYECLLLPEAEDEYISSYIWYEEQQADLGERFAKSFRNKLSHIADNPLKYKVVKGVFREAILSKPFPFVIVYFINEEERHVLITSVFHTSRNPKKKFIK